MQSNVKADDLSRFMEDFSVLYEQGVFLLEEFFVESINLRNGNNVAEAKLNLAKNKNKKSFKQNKIHFMIFQRSQFFLEKKV